MHNGDSQQQSAHWGKPLPSSVVGIGLGLVLGLAIFLLCWRIPLIRAEATALVLAVPKTVWLFFLLLAIVGCARGVWVLVTATDLQEEAGATPVATPQLHRSEQQLPRAAFEEAPSSTPPESAEHRQWPVKPTTLLSITLLHELTLTLHLPGGRGTRLIPMSPTTKRAQLLAYIAARQGEVVHRDKILYYLFAWRREDGTADEEQTANNFHAHTRLLRNQIREVILQVNAEAGELLIDPNLDPFVTNKENWSLAPFCEVVDLGEIDRNYHLISQARKSGLLTNEIPLFVKEACERLLAAYTGDFLADLIKQNLEDFKPWDGKSSWAKRFTTHYRTCWLTAQWYLGQYEEYRAQQCYAVTQTLREQGWEGDGVLARVETLLGTKTVEASGQRAEGSAATRNQLLILAVEYEQQQSYGKAIERYKNYALAACQTPYYIGSPYDDRVSYNPTSGQFGDRIKGSEQALRRCLKACAFTGNTREASEVYATYATQMTALFHGWGLEWQPSPETQHERDSVSALTDAHRFSQLAAPPQASPVDA